MNCKSFNNAEALDGYLKKLSSPIAFDTETFGTGYFDDIIMMSFYDGENEPAYAYTNNLFPDGIPQSELVEVCNKYFPKWEVICHNAKFDLGKTQRIGIKDPKLKADTSLYVHIWSPDNDKQLEKCLSRDLKWDKKTYKEVIGKNWNKIDWDKDIKPSVNKKTGKTEPPVITHQNMGEYACEDVVGTYKLYEYYRPKLEKEGLLAMNDNIEQPLVWVLRDMFTRGITINKPFLEGLSTQVAPVLADLTTNIFKESGRVFNLNSPQQKAKVLFEEMKLPMTKKTPTGNASSDAETLEYLAALGYPIAKYMVEYSEVETLRSKFIDAIPSLVDEDGKLRCSLNSTGTRTGRFSCSDPNLQNQPNNKRFPVRASFTHSPGYKLLVADYSQIEPRVMAHLSKDPKMVGIYLEAGDIYIGIAHELGVTRDQAKVIQLAISYGMGADKLAAMLGVSKKEGQNFINLYYEKYHVFRDWKTSVEEEAARTGKIKTMFGRVRRLPNAFSSERGLYYGAMRQAVNTVVQGSAADMIKLSMINLHKTWQNKDAHMMLQVHDELVNEARVNIVEEAYNDLITTMENVVKLRVPLKAEGKVCFNWSQMKDKSFASLLDASSTETIVNLNQDDFLWQQVLLSLN